MDLQEAKDLLDGCVRNELRDHAFGDVEVTWYLGSQFVAEGYFGGTSEVNISASEVNHRSEAKFVGELAEHLRRCGTPGEIERNDETGPDQFVQGQMMPGLTKEGVFEELTRPPQEE